MNNPIKIVIADDHQILNNCLANYFKDFENFQIIGWAASGKEAIELACRQYPDIVIMDVSMPDMNGMEATQQICNLNRKIKVIGLSMHAERIYISGMLNAGASGYLLKSCSFNELISAIQTVLDGEQYFCKEAQSILNSVHNHCRIDDIFSLLSKREREILQLIAEGMKTKDIARKLHISNRTVDIHRSNLKNKLKIYTVAELTKFAISHGITSPSL